MQSSSQLSKTPTPSPQSNKYQQPGSPSATQSSTRATTVSNIQNSITALLVDTATQAATLLALMLRYATYVQPVDQDAVEDKFASPTKPKTSSYQNEKPNIFSVIISTTNLIDSEIRLQEIGGSSKLKANAATVNNFRCSSDMLLRLKLRLIAALGELTFYISAQGPNPSAGAHWQIPKEVWNTLIFAMNFDLAEMTRDTKISKSVEYTEISRHYATKVSCVLLCYKLTNKFKICRH